MTALNAAAGLSLGAAIPLVALSGAGPDPAAVIAALRATAEHMAAPPPHLAEVRVAFDGEGRVASSLLTRSAGSRPSDTAALEEALQLASLEPREAVAGRTLVFTARFNAAAG